LPTYEYTCAVCGHRLEAVQKFSDAALTVCPDCGGELRKVYGAVGIVLKGSGFYKTDSRAASNGKAKSTAKDTSSNSESSSESSGSSGSPDSNGSSASKETSSKPETKPAASTAS
jgi:putative FmdB family regulatory protein